jgi:hypothetical protein
MGRDTSPNRATIPLDATQINKVAALPTLLAHPGYAPRKGKKGQFNIKTGAVTQGKRI